MATTQYLAAGNNPFKNFSNFSEKDVFTKDELIKIYTSHFPEQPNVVFDSMVLPWFQELGMELQEVNS